MTVMRKIQLLQLLREDQVESSFVVFVCSTLYVVHSPSSST